MRLSLLSAAAIALLAGCQAGGRLAQSGPVPVRGDDRPVSGLATSSPSSASSTQTKLPTRPERLETLTAPLTVAEAAPLLRPTPDDHTPRPAKRSSERLHAAYWLPGEPSETSPAEALSGTQLAVATELQSPIVPPSTMAEVQPPRLIPDFEAIDPTGPDGPASFAPAPAVVLPPALDSFGPDADLAADLDTDQAETTIGRSLAPAPNDVSTNEGSEPIVERIVPPPTPETVGGLGIDGVLMPEDEFLCRSMQSSAAVQAAALEAASLRQLACESRCTREMLSLTSRVVLYRRAQRAQEQVANTGTLYRRAVHAVRLRALASESVVMLAAEREAAQEAYDAGIADEPPLLALQTALAQAQVDVAEADAVIVSTRSQLAAAAGLAPGSQLTPTEPLVEIPNLTPQAAANLAIRQRPELNLLRTVLCGLNEKTLPVARGVVSGVDASLGVETEISCGLLKVIRRDNSCEEILLRRRQLTAALAEAERVAAAEARSAAERRIGAAVEAELAAATIADAQEELQALEALREIDETITDADLLDVRVRLLSAKKDLAEAEARRDVAAHTLDAAVANPLFRCGILRR